MSEVRLIDANAAADKIMRETEVHADEIGVGGVALMIGFARALRDETSFPTIDAQPVWIPCSERLPEIYERVLTADRDGNVTENFRLNIKTGELEWSKGFWITHWKPLPEPPEGGNQG